MDAWHLPCCCLQTLARAYNEGLDALAEGVRCTARSPAAAWGLPAPELALVPPGPEAAAPQCWHPAQVEAAAASLLQAKVPEELAVQVLQQGGGMQAMVALLHTRFTHWAAARGPAAPSHILLLPQLLPRPSSDLPLGPGLGSSGPTSFLARSPGGFASPHMGSLGALARRGSGSWGGASGPGLLLPPPYVSSTPGRRATHDDILQLQRDQQQQHNSNGAYGFGMGASNGGSGPVTPVAQQKQDAWGSHPLPGSAFGSQYGGSAAGTPWAAGVGGVRPAPATPYTGQQAHPFSAAPSPGDVPHVSLQCGLDGAGWRVGGNGSLGAGGYGPAGPRDVGFSWEAKAKAEDVLQQLKALVPGPPPPSTNGAGWGQ